MFRSSCRQLLGRLYSGRSIRSVTLPTSARNTRSGSTSTYVLTNTPPRAPLTISPLPQLTFHVQILRIFISFGKLLFFTKSLSFRNTITLVFVCSYVTLLICTVATTQQVVNNNALLSQSLLYINMQLSFFNL